MHLVDIRRRGAGIGFVEPQEWGGIVAVRSPESLDSGQQRLAKSSETLDLDLLPPLLQRHEFATSDGVGEGWRVCPSPPISPTSIPPRFPGGSPETAPYVVSHLAGGTGGRSGTGHASELCPINKTGAA